MEDPFQDLRNQLELVTMERDLLLQELEQLRAQNEKLKFPREQLKGTLPVVLYFPDDGAREEFVRLVQQACPNLKAENL